MKYIKIFLILLLANSIGFAQFGQNKVQYKEFNWLYIQTKHFDIYFTEQGKDIAEFTAKIAEDALNNYENVLNYQINNRITIIVYNSHNDFQETNTTEGYLGQGTGGFTEPFKNRVVLPFEGSYSKFRHVIRHELVHAVMRDFLYGGTIQNIIAKGITLQLPIWYHEGMAEYLSMGWETNSDMFLSDAIISEYLPDIKQLGGYFAYRGGQSLFKYIADTYGKQKVGELLSRVKGAGSLNAGLKATLGLKLDELNDRWKKALKKQYWPAIDQRQDPDDFSKRLTNNKKTRGFYNTSPAISPQGDKIAFISDRDIYLDVYIMNSFDGKMIKRVVESGKSADFEELNVLFPSLTWAPDNKRIALSLKSDGYDKIYVINTETDEEEPLPFKLDGIESVSWSPDGNKIAFLGSNSKESDIYVYNFKTKHLDNLTQDIFSDYQPSWTPDSKKIIFSSDRKNYNKNNFEQDGYTMTNLDYTHLDLYMLDIDSKNVTRLTDWKLSDETSAVVSPDGKEILFTSDYNGITNIYKKRIALSDTDTVSTLLELPAVPITNSLNGINQLSLSKDGKKMAFTSLFNGGYNIFLLNNPFDMKPVGKELVPTKFMKKLIDQENPPKIVAVKDTNKTEIDSTLSFKEITTAVIDSTNEKKSPEFFSGQYSEKTSKSDTTASESYKHFVFGGENFNADTTSLVQKKQKLFTEKLDRNGNFLVNKYKVNFSPDLIYANAGYSSLYGLLGTTVLTFSDVLGNHRLIGTTSLQIDLKNSDYGLAYYYLAKKIDYGFEGYHTARFVYLSNGFSSDLYRFRSFGGIISARMPINRFYRIDAGLSVQSVSSENLDNLAVPTDRSTFFIPSFSFVHDNTMFGYTSPIEGVRYNLTLFGNPGFGKTRQSFISATWDYRKYFRFWFDNSFAIRLSGGYSAGANPQRFFLGGTEGWLNRTFATGDIPLRNAADFAFLTPALPLRGYDYAQQIGTKYSLLNLELRMPLIRYLLTGPLPILFRNILGVAFIDAGTAWHDNKSLRLFKKDKFGSLQTQDLLIGTGFGARLYFIFLWKFDVAWKYNFQGFSEPRYYISIGLDF